MQLDILHLKAKEATVNRIFCFHDRLTDFLRDALETEEKQLTTQEPKIWFSSFFPDCVVSPQCQSVVLPKDSVILKIGSDDEFSFLEEGSVESLLRDEDLSGDELKKLLCERIKKDWVHYSSSPDVNKQLVLKEGGTKAIVYYESKSNDILLFSVIEGTYRSQPRGRSGAIDKITLKLFEHGCRNITWRSSNSRLTPGARMRECLEEGFFVVTVAAPDRVEVCIPMTDLEGVATKEEILLLSTYMDYDKEFIFQE